MGQAANGPAAIGPLLRTVRYRYDVVVDGTRSLSRRSTSDGRGGSDSVVYNDEAMSWTCSSQPTVATPAIAAISGPDPRLAAQTMGPALYLAGALGAPTGESWFSLLAAQPFTAARDACVGEPAVRVTYVPDARAGLEAYVWFIPAKGWAVGAVRMPIDRNYQAQGSVAEWARVGGLWYAKRWIGSSVARPGTALAKEPFNVESVDVDRLDLAPDPAAVEARFDPLRSLPDGSEINDHRLGISYWLRGSADESSLDAVAETLQGLLEARGRDVPSVPEDLWRYRGAAGRDASRCGPDCLALLLRFRNVRVPADELAKASGWSSADGTTFAGLAEAASASGVPLAGVKLGYADLLRLGSPGIVPLNYEHFILFVAERNGKVYFVEPPDVIQSMTPKRFLELWTGEALVFEDLLKG